MVPLARWRTNVLIQPLGFPDEGEYGGCAARIAKNVLNRALQVRRSWSLQGWTRLTSAADQLRLVRIFEGVRVHWHSFF